MHPRPDHREAVARRLELLRAEINTPAPSSEDEPWWETAPVLELVPEPADDPGAPLVPVPGRHAARRRTAGPGRLGDRMVALLPDTLRGRVGVGPWHLTVLALVVATGLAVTCWWMMRGDPRAAPVTSRTATPLVTVSAEPGAAETGPAAGATKAATVTVDVAGKVRRPGVLELPSGSRVVDAIEAAGGARPGADLSGLNRARVLVDGEQVLVGRPMAAGTPGPVATGSAAGAPAPLVNLNTAAADDLDTLPGVGPVTAQAILAYRTEHGGFGSVDELLDVDGIGPATLARLAPHVTV